ncbi:MAG: long-chain fatty acid--CoA ligase [Desulfobacca sp.]|nr:long-chain fatty acid--CoA ligase [Desulfobacca sp.]
MNVGNWLYKRSLVSPEKTAIIFNKKALTYQEMNRRVNRLSQAFIQMGLNLGDRVGVLSRNSPEFLEIYFACAKTGMIFVPLNFRLAPPEVAYQLNDSRLRVLFFDLELAPLIEKSRPFLSIEVPQTIGLGSIPSDSSPLYEALIQDQSDLEPLLPEDTVTWDTAQMIMYTSGTTGTPKGVLLSHQKTLFNTLNAQIFFDLYSKDIMLSVLPLFHSGALNIMTVPTLYAGGKIVLQSRFIPQEFLNLIEQHRVTQTILVPTMLNTLLKEARPEEHDLSSLRTMLVGGEPVSIDLMHQALDRGLPVRQIFGQTESSIQLWVPPERAREKAGAAGLPVFHGEVRVVNHQGQKVPTGEVGEIIVKGPIQMMGYWNAPEETEKVIKDGWLYTGDLGYLDRDGFFYLVDRKKDMYISGGENVYPAEIEKILLTHPSILEAAIIGVPDEKWGLAGRAFISLKKGATLHYEEMVLFLKDQIASYKIPKSMEIIIDLPKTASEKIKKRILGEPFFKK